MKLRVEISWNESSKLDRLQAFVIQNGVRGSDLLAGHRYTVVDSAVEHIDKVLLDHFKLLDAPDIEYVVEGETKQ